MILRVEGLIVQVTPRGSRTAVSVVREATFSLDRGEIACLVGESGSGKTVLMRAILGIDQADPGVVAGTAWFRPRDQREAVTVLPRISPRRQRALPQLRAGWAGYVFQHPVEALDPFLTVGAQVAASIRVVRPDVSAEALRERVQDFLAAVRLPEPHVVARLYPHELSGGMAQRVAIAIAIATEPEILVADEPTTGLDWSVRREVVDLLVGLCQERGMTLLFITHDFGVVRHVADRVLVMYRGELLEDGPRSAFFEPGPGRHPYSSELQGRVHALREGRRPEEALAALDEPRDVGCRFAHRCPVVLAPDPLDFVGRCRSERPPDRRMAEDHTVRCFAVREPGS